MKNLVEQFLRESSKVMDDERLEPFYNWVKEESERLEKEHYSNEEDDELCGVYARMRDIKHSLENQHKRTAEEIEKNFFINGKSFWWPTPRDKDCNKVVWSGFQKAQLQAEEKFYNIVEI